MDTSTGVLNPNPPYGTAKPAVGVPFNDVAHGETLYRITDAIGAGIDNFSTEYSSTCLTNANSTVLRLPGASGGHRFYELVGGIWTITKVKSLAARGPSDVWWHPTIADVAYTLAYPIYFYRYNYSTNAQTLLRNFAVTDGFTDCQDGGENHLSNDGSLYAFYTPTDIVLYNIDTDTIVAQKTVMGNSYGGVTVSQFKDITVSGNGQQVLFTGTNTNRFFIFEVDGLGGFTHVATPPGAIGHKDSNTGPDGVDYMFADYGGINNIKRIKFSDGSTQNARTDVFPGYGALPPPSQGFHISCHTMPDDGYIYAGFYNGTQAQVPGTSSWGYLSQEMARFQYDQSGDVERIAHMRSPHGTDYYKQDKTNVSRDGKWLFFTSDWENISAKYADVYAVILSATANQYGVASLSGVGTLALSATLDHAGAASLSGAGTLGITGTVIPFTAPQPPSTHYPRDGSGGHVASVLC